jgi:hypothetical protein
MPWTYSAKKTCSKASHGITAIIIRQTSISDGATTENATRRMKYVDGHFFSIPSKMFEIPLHHKHRIDRRFPSGLSV